MKTYIRIFLGVMMVMAGCQTIDLPCVQQIQDNAPSSISSSMKVNPDVVETYLRAFKGVVSTKVADVTVDPVMNGGDTVMYLVNYPEGGWELLSADKRIPTRLMVGETGSMTISQIEEHPGMSILLNDMREQISAVKRSEQTQPVTEKGVFWDRISPCENETKAGNILWNLYNTEVVSVNELCVEHLIDTKWGQSEVDSHWYNRYVPYKNSLKEDTKYGRCLVGCVPVACAQILNYLQSKFEFTTTYTFLESRCDAYISDGETSVLYGALNPVTNTFKSNDLYWKYVGRKIGSPIEQDKAIASLMAYLGVQLEAEYKYVCRESSWSRATSAKFNLIKPRFQSCYDIDCEESIWDNEIVIESLLNDMPIIVRANKENDPGHCWIVDGYYAAEKLINYYYMGIDPTSPYEPIYKMEQYPGEYEEYFLMNWGWGGEHDDDVCYVDSQSWTVSNGSYDLSTRKMIYGFNK